MTVMLLILGVGLFAIILDAVANTENAQMVLSRTRGLKNHLPKAVSMVLMLAQVSELGRAVQNSEHVSLIGIVATLILFTIWAATKSGTEI